MLYYNEIIVAVEGKKGKMNMSGHLKNRSETILKEG